MVGFILFQYLIQYAVNNAYKSNYYTMRNNNRGHILGDPVIASILVLTRVCDSTVGINYHVYIALMYCLCGQNRKFWF